MKSEILVCSEFVLSKSGSTLEELLAGTSKYFYDDWNGIH